MLPNPEQIEKSTNILVRIWRNSSLHQALLVALFCFLVAYLIREAETKSYDQRIADCRFTNDDLKGQISTLQNDLKREKESRFEDINRTAIFLENIKNGKASELYKQQIKIDSL